MRYQPNLRLSFERSDRVFKEKLNVQVQRNIISAIKELTQGVINVDQDNPQIIETSQNIDSLNRETDKILLKVSQRSLDADKLDEAIDNTKDVLEKHGFCIIKEKKYSGWRMGKDNELVELFLNEYKKMYNCNVYKQVVHAGLECGILSGKLGIKNVIAFGATCYDIHTVYETASISSTKKAFIFLMHMLNVLQQKSKDFVE